jgi:transcriptional regulator with XRE-family HTH domain
MTFAETLRRLREAAGLTQAALAERAGLSLRTVQSWEQGRRAPVSPAFFKLAEALGAKPDAFAKCQENPPPKKTTRRKKT